MSNRERQIRPRPFQQSYPEVTLAIVTILVGLGAGVGGMVLALLLHFIQHVAYGYSLNAVISPESFLQGVMAALPLRRILVLLACGLVAGFGWWAVYRFCRPLVSIKKAVGSDDPRMPVIATTAHALLQIVTVALGSPLGREVAPREIGAMFAGWLANRAGLSAGDARIMVACGAGAGLAAVYNVPLAGALFTLEVLLGTLAPSAVIPAIATSAIATIVAWSGLGDVPQYVLPPLEISPALIVISILAGPVFGFAGYWYARLATVARKKTRRGWRLIASCVVVFVMIGALSVEYPELLGNGKGPLQLGFDNHIGLKLAVVLLILKLLSTTGSLWAGAEGGLLTPGLAVGAVLAICLSHLWNLVLPGVAPAAFALVGGTAFLAASMQMPLTAIVLIFEFTHAGQDFLIPISLAVAGSIAALRMTARLYEKASSRAPSNAAACQPGKRPSETGAEIIIA